MGEESKGQLHHMFLPVQGDIVSFLLNFEDCSTFTFEMLVKINDDRQWIPCIDSLVLDESAVAADHSSE